MDFSFLTPEVSRRCWCRRMWYSKEVILTAFAALRALTASMSSESARSPDWAPDLHFIFQAMISIDQRLEHPVFSSMISHASSSASM